MHDAATQQTHVLKTKLSLTVLSPVAVSVADVLPRLDICHVLYALFFRHLLSWRTWVIRPPTFCSCRRPLPHTSSAFGDAPNTGR